MNSHQFRFFLCWRHIYRKWNERLFEEMYAAYVEGRTDQDPTESWYVFFSEAWIKAVILICAARS